MVLFASFFGFRHKVHPGVNFLIQHISQGIFVFPEFVVHCDEFEIFDSDESDLVSDVPQHCLFVEVVVAQRVGSQDLVQVLVVQSYQNSVGFCSCRKET